MYCIVSGLPRSGMSAVMQLLEAGGFPLVYDNAREADEDNPRGYYDYSLARKLTRGGDLRWLNACEGRALKVPAPAVTRLPNDRNYLILFMLRSFPEVIASSRVAYTRRGYPPDDLETAYRTVLANALSFLGLSRNVESSFCSYGSLLAGPALWAETIIDFFDRTRAWQYDLEAAAKAIDSRLYRQRRADLNSNNETEKEGRNAG